MFQEVHQAEVPLQLPRGFVMQLLGLTQVVPSDSQQRSVESLVTSQHMALSAAMDLLLLPQALTKSAPSQQQLKMPQL